MTTYAAHGASARSRKAGDLPATMKQATLPPADEWDYNENRRVLTEAIAALDVIRRDLANLHLVDDDATLVGVNKAITGLTATNAQLASCRQLTIVNLRVRGRAWTSITDIPGQTLTTSRLVQIYQGITGNSIRKKRKAADESAKQLSDADASDAA